jgi:hypothetical protein
VSRPPQARTREPVFLLMQVVVFLYFIRTG